MARPRRFVTQARPTMRLGHPGGAPGSTGARSRRPMAAARAADLLAPYGRTRRARSLGPRPAVPRGRWMGSRRTKQGRRSRWQRDRLARWPCVARVKSARVRHRKKTCADAGRHGAGLKHRAELLAPVGSAWHRPTLAAAVDEGVNLQDRRASSEASGCTARPAIDWTGSPGSPPSSTAQPPFHAAWLTGRARLPARP